MRKPFILLAVFVLGFYCSTICQVMGDRTALIRAMEYARSTHQFYVDNPSKDHWTRAGEMNAQWVIIYDAVIKELK